MRRLTRISAALAVALFLAGQAKADFNYSTAVTPSPPGGSPLTFGSSSLTYDPPTPPPGTQSTALGSVGISIAAITVDRSGTSTAVDSTSLTITDTITIMPVGGGSGILTVVGTAAATTGYNSVTNSYSQNSTFTYTGGITSVTINGVKYTYDTVQFSQPTVNTPDSGGLSVTVHVTPVPEPASMALVGVGGLLLAAPRLRRLVRRIARPERA